MSDKYKIYDPDRSYFLTMTVIGWIDLFSRKNHKLLIVDSLKYCQNHKGLLVYGWCLMPSHLHLIAGSNGKYNLSDILRDFKKFTSKHLIQQIKEEPESRRDWLLRYFAFQAKVLKRIENYKVWKDGNHSEIIYSSAFFHEKLKYIHDNPVKAKIVEFPEEYIFSSARNYADREFLIDVILESTELKTY